MLTYSCYTTKIYTILVEFRYTLALQRGTVITRRDLHCARSTYRWFTIWVNILSFVVRNFAPSNSALS